LTAFGTVSLLWFLLIMMLTGFGCVASVSSTSEFRPSTMLLPITGN
jgi:hypothetical protein